MCSNNQGCDQEANTFTFTVEGFSQFVLGFIDQEGPVVSNVAADPNPVMVNANVTLTAEIDDTNTGGSNIDSVQYSLNDGETWSEMDIDTGLDPSSATAHVIFSIPEPGVYNLCVRGWDVYRNFPGNDECILLVVYDPDGGVSDQ